IASIFDASRIAPMAEQYVSALWHTYTPLLYVAFVASVLASLRGHSQSPELRRLCWTACASAIVLLASYAPYSVFDLRFLLPAVVLLIVASTATMGAWTESWSPTVRALAFGMAATLLPLGFVHQASHAGAWRLHEIFSQRFVESGRRARMLPDGAVLMSIVESGSLRFYGGRLTLRFDWLPAGSLDAAVEYLSNRGRAVYFAGAASELTQFQDTFSTSRVAHAMLAEPVDHPVSDTDVRFIALVPGASGR
ncbi:MAG TPA: hypothetical protein VFZ98_06550, partial [Vicinamibacterales bacterium]